MSLDVSSNAPRTLYTVHDGCVTVVLNLCYFLRFDLWQYRIAVPVVTFLQHLVAQM